jgi:hypothetical protein
MQGFLRAEPGSQFAIDRVEEVDLVGATYFDRRAPDSVTA